MPLIKLNLLPISILEQRRVRRTILVAALILLVELGALGYWFLQTETKVKAAQEAYETTKRQADFVRGLESKITQTQNEMQAPQARVQWYQSVHQTNAKWADNLVKLNLYVPDKVVIERLQYQGASINLDGRTDNLRTIANYFLNMLRNVMVVEGGVQLANISGPGWPPGSGTTGGGAVLASAPSFGRGGGGPMGGGRGGPGMGGGRGGPGFGGGDFAAQPQQGQQVQNPREQMGVTLNLSLLPEYVVTPPVPPGATGSVGGGGGMGGGMMGRGGMAGGPMSGGGLPARGGGMGGGPMGR